MGKFMMVAGAIWGAIGALNVLMGAANGISSGVLTFSIIFNGAVFCFPGLVVYALGARLANPKTAAPSRSPTDRLTDLDAMKANGQISDDEHLTRRAAIIAET
jgi:hypothetical protein